MVEDSKSAELPVLIIGAGISGLAIANGLHLKGIPYKVFDRDPALSLRNGRDWGIAFHWSVPLLASLVGPEKWSRVSSTLADPNIPISEVEHFPLYSGRTGKIIARSPIPNLHRILRSRMRALLAADLPDVHFGKKLEGVEYAADGRGVTARFADGTAETGRLVVGADGSQSRVRGLLLGEKAKLKRLPLAATFVTSSFPADVAVSMRAQVHPIINAFVHPDNMMGMFAILDGSDKDRPENWQFAFYVSWSCSVEEQDAEAGMGIKERLAQVKEKSKAFAEPLRTAFELVPDNNDKVYYVTNGNWDPSPPEHGWDNHGGRVTLVGDAAHPMTYHRGQGLNQSINDAYKLVEQLTNPENRSQAELISAYESEMRPRSGDEVRQSEVNSLMLHNWEKAEQSPLMKRGVAYGSKPVEKS
ncbi:FAD/NAD(P)-binding domain-containing protein [Jackrogersella minutella]|nr:FAD/NAD(P)-binding domain-containing protein [Jackrogersella minutella]